ncbi:MAG TPA: acyl-CoA dehydrogenase family protein, partial [Sphingobium sp.]|nr:acyl-CoA dehydrogenase family protein [Sphingobium sp.]
MDFNPSEEQRMLADSVDRFVQSRYDLDKRRAYQAEPTSFSNENWNMLAELGLTALIVPEGDGGLGASR